MTLPMLGLTLVRSCGNEEDNSEHTFPTNIASLTLPALYLDL